MNKSNILNRTKSIQVAGRGYKYNVFGSSGAFRNIQIMDSKGNILLDMITEVDNCSKSGVKKLISKL